VQVIVSNTADQGYLLDAQDGPTSLAADGPVPASFPAKLLVLLHHRWANNPRAPLSIFPCELIERNGDTLRDLLLQLAHDWAIAPAFADWLRGHCIWANSLVDRIVSEAITPVGAVAEPYALWAIENQPGLVLPCRHPAIVLTDDLASYAQLKLYLLNGGHTVLAERWLRDGRPADETVVQAMADAGMRAELEAVWAAEILPVFEAIGRQPQAEAYLAQVRERLLNPFLAHRLADIAQNHVQKKQRRFAPLLALAEKHGLDLPQTRLRAALASTT
jgi:tagaturonate reductase